MAAFFMSAAISFSQTKEQKPDTKAFLNRYQNLVMRMEKASANGTVTKDSIYAWKDERTAIKRLYSDTYKRIFTDDEVEKYFAISTDYKTTRASINLDKVGDNVSTTMKRTGKKISGWFGGSKK
ncbi:MAG: hypothetical protein ACI3Y5_03475 [Prevotella sp.]